MRLRTPVLLLQLVVIAVSLAVGFGWVVVGADDRIRDEYAQRALAIAQSVASDTEVRTGVAATTGTNLDPAALAAGPVQTQANAVRERTGALFVVIANRQGIRLAHPESCSSLRQSSLQSWISHRHHIQQTLERVQTLLLGIHASLHPVVVLVPSRIV